MFNGIIKTEYTDWYNKSSILNTKLLHSKCAQHLWNNEEDREIKPRTEERKYSQSNTNQKKKEANPGKVITDNVIQLLMKLCV